jgi:hypothetical protein
MPAPRLRLTVVIVVSAAALTTCDRRAQVTTCDDDLHGVWVTGQNTRWMILDNGPTIEAYPLFDDHVDGGGPRVIDLSRSERFTGEVKRRYNQGANECIASAPLRIAKCKENTLNVVIADPPSPLSFSPCAWPRPNESELDHWHRE